MRTLRCPAKSSVPARHQSQVLNWSVLPNVVIMQMDAWEPLGGASTGLSSPWEQSLQWGWLSENRKEDEGSPMFLQHRMEVSGGGRGKERQCLVSCFFSHLEKQPCYMSRLVGGRQSNTFTPENNDTHGLIPGTCVTPYDKCFAHVVSLDIKMEPGAGGTCL